MNQHSTSSSHPAPTWDENTAKWYISNFGEHPTNRATVELAELLPGERLLDIGCGSGAAIREAVQLTLLDTAIGVDPTPAMIRAAGELSANILPTGRVHFLIAPAEHLPLATATFTVALAINSVNHWPDLLQGLAEAYRVLAPSGRLFIADELHIEQSGELDDSLNMAPQLVAQALHTIGFAQVAISHHPVAGEMMSLVKGIKPAG